MFAIYSCFGHNTINYSRTVCLVGGVRVYLQEKCIFIAIFKKKQWYAKY
jgi:hypothetical protein